MSMACSLSSFCSFNQQVLSRHKIIFHYPMIMRSQSFRDNGKPENSVDANLSVLRERIQRVREKERLRNTCGWNYEHNYEPKYKRSDHAIILSESAKIMSIAGGAIGLVFLFGSLCIFLVSFLVHM